MLEIRSKEAREGARGRKLDRTFWFCAVGVCRVECQAFLSAERCGIARKDPMHRSLQSSSDRSAK